MQYLVMDFETRSTLDINEVSSRRYASDQSTDILCIGLKWNDRPAKVFTPVTGPVLDGRIQPIQIMEAIRIGCPVVVHNRSFEERIYRHICVERFGWPEIHLDQWVDTMASCSYYAVPRSLKKAGVALGLSMQKDTTLGMELDEDDDGKPKKGKTRHVLTQVCKPRSHSKKAKENWLAEGRAIEDMPVIWWEDQPRLDALYKYCEADCESQDELFKTLGPLPPDRMVEWRLDCEINERGLPVDWCALHTVSEVVNSSLAGYNERLAFLTRTPAYPEGMVKTISQNAKLKDWCSLKGIEMVSLDKAAVIDALARADVVGDVREVLTLKQDAGKSSLGKLETMLLSADEDQRIRDPLVWHGAATGRKAGRGIQIQNYPNNCLSGQDLDDFHSALYSIDPDASVAALVQRMDRSLPDVVASALRSFIRAEDGKKFCISDLSNIETRNLAWVAGCRMLNDAFASGDCPYKQFAGLIYNIADPQKNIDKKDKKRVLGKVSVLALGYGMGSDKFSETAAGPLYQIELGQTQANEIKELYRSTYWEVPEFWSACEKGMRTAIEERTTVQVNKVSFGCNGTWGWIVLPSGRPIWYYKPQVAQRSNRFREGKTSKQIVYMGIDSVTKQWKERSTYGGSIVESICQGMAGCLLQAICDRSKAAGYDVIFTVHDEIVAEVPSHYPLEPFHQLVKARPNWCLDLPIECESHETQRYGK